MIEKTPLQCSLLIFSMIFIGSFICLSGHSLILFIETIAEINDKSLDPFRDEPQIFFTLLGSIIIPPLIGISITGVITHGINLITKTKATGRTMQPVPDIKISLLRVSLIILIVTGIILFMDFAAFIADNADVLYDNTSVNRRMRRIFLSADLEDTFFLPLVLPLLATSPYTGTIFILSSLIFTFFVLPAAHLCLAQARNDIYLNSLKKEQKERSISTSSQSITITKPTPTITKSTSPSLSKPNGHNSNSSESRLQQLGILRDSGIISLDEYTAQYQRILNEKSTSPSLSKPNGHDSNSFESRLQQLGILLDSGLISPAEHTEQYQRLLNEKSTSPSLSKPNGHDSKSSESRLQQLGILRDSGIISLDEYTAQYQRILNEK